MIDFDHSQNIHTAAGSRAAMSVIFGECVPGSLLDVGCGVGSWLASARALGVTDIMGLDGVMVPSNKLLIAASQVRQQDLRRAWNLGRRFGAAMCLEVAEHLDADDAHVLIDALAAHANWIIFSAACPDQPGRHHVNCQWPAYWQYHFNARGFVCSDDIRWKIWDIQEIEPWYRQNMFMARLNKEQAGSEPRLKSVVHPSMLKYLQSAAVAAAIDNEHPIKVWLLSLWHRFRKGHE